MTSRLGTGKRLTFFYSTVYRFIQCGLKFHCYIFPVVSVFSIEYDKEEEIEHVYNLIQIISREC